MEVQIIRKGEMTILIQTEDDIQTNRQEKIMNLEDLIMEELEVKKEKEVETKNIGLTGFLKTDIINTKAQTTSLEDQRLLKLRDLKEAIETEEKVDTEKEET